MAHARLPVARVVWETFAIPAKDPRAYFEAAGLPLLAVVAASFGWMMQQRGAGGFERALRFAVYLLAISWLAVRTHRLLLLGAGEARELPFARERNATAKYLGAALAGSIAFMVLFLLIGEALGQALVWLAPPVHENPGLVLALTRYLPLAASLLPMYLVARFILVLPDIALERAFDLRTAWKRSLRNGWRIVVTTLLLPWLLEFFIDLLGAYAFNLVLIGLVVVLYGLVLSLGVIALSLSYRELATAPTAMRG